MANEYRDEHKDSDKEIMEVIEFLKQVIRLIVLWLKTFPSYFKSVNFIKLF